MLSSIEKNLLINQSKVIEKHMKIFEKLQMESKGWMIWRWKKTFLIKRLKVIKKSTKKIRKITTSPGYWAKSFLKTIISLS